MPSSEPLWLPIEEVIQINREAVGLTGEPFHLLKPELLESALDNPKNKFAYGEKDMLSLAMALLLALARNHPFLQGNKRTAFLAAENNAADDEELAEMIIECIEDDTLSGALEEYLRAHIVAAPEDI